MLLTEYVEEGVGKDVAVRVAGIALDDQHIILSYSTELEAAAAGAKQCSRMLAGIYQSHTVSTLHTNSP